MSMSIKLRSTMMSVNESMDGSSSDEYYVPGIRATLRVPNTTLPIPVAPNFGVVTYGVFKDMDDDDDARVLVKGLPFLVMNGAPSDIVGPSSVAIVAPVMEFDNSGAAQYSRPTTSGLRCRWLPPPGYAMLFDGFLGKGAVPATGTSTHQAIGCDFRLDHVDIGQSGETSGSLFGAPH